LWLADTLFSALYLFVWLFGWVERFDPRAGWNTYRNDWLLVAGYMLIFGGSFPLSLPLVTTADSSSAPLWPIESVLLKDWIVDQLKGVAIAGPIGCSWSN